MMLLVLKIVHHVLKTLITGIKQGHQLAYHVMKVRRRKKEVPNAKPVEPVPMVMDVNPATKVNTVTAVTLLRSPAEIAQRVTTTTTMAKVLVCPAYLENSMTKLVLLNANFAKRTHFRKTNIANILVNNAPPERYRSTEVSNVIEPHAKRAPIKISLMANAKTAHKVGNRKIWTLRYAHNAPSAPPLCPILLVEVLRVLGVILVHLVVGKAFAKNVRPGSIKIQKANRNALNVKQDCFTSMLRHNAVVVIWASTAVHRGNVPNVFCQTRTLIFVVPLEIVHFAHLEKYPTKNLRGVNCHRGVPVKCVNI